MTSGVRVLVVDDSQAMLNIVEKLLRLCGFANVEQAHSGQEALRMMRERRHQLVFCDVNMPGMDGVQLLEVVRKDRWLSDTCFVMITATPSLDAITSAKHLGADCILMKPFSVQSLKMKLADVPKLRQLRPSEVEEVDLVPTT